MKFPDISVLYSLFLQTPSVTTDSRKAAAGTIFFALKGDNFNGNQFAESALKLGCSYVIVDEEEYYLPPLIPPSGGNAGASSPLRGAGGQYILVKDCLATLQELAAYHRQQFKIPFIAITGSNGKTTTKEFINSILSKKYRVLATAGNLNNHIGVPLTLLSVTSDIEIAIIEMGANHIGEIAMLCGIAQPDYGIITNIGRAHIGEFGSFEAIVKAKTEMYAFLRQKKGRVFINSSNELLMSNASGIEQISYGCGASDFCRAEFVGSDPFLTIKYEGDIITSQLVGKYNFENILAALCIGKHFGVDAKKMKEAVEEYAPSNNRSQVVKTKMNTLVLDAYNANPSSMKAALQNFIEMPGENKWPILGDMRELGSYALQEHINILEFTANKFKNVILVGTNFMEAVTSSRDSRTIFHVFRDTDLLVETLKHNSPIKGPALILVKGSRGIKLEKVVEFL